MVHNMQAQPDSPFKSQYRSTVVKGEERGAYGEGEYSISSICIQEGIDARSFPYHAAFVGRIQTQFPRSSRMGET